MNPTLSELIEFAMFDKVGPRISSAVSRFGYPGAKSLAGRLCMWLRDKGRPSVSPSRLNRRVPQGANESRARRPLPPGAVTCRRDASAETLHARGGGVGGAAPSR